MNSTKIKNKNISCLISKFVMLKWSILTVCLLKLFLKVLLLPFIWELDLFTLKWMCVMIMKKLHWSMFRLSANNFHIFVGLTVNCDSIYHSQKLNVLNDIFVRKEWVFHIHMEILHLNLKEWKYSQNSSLNVDYPSIQNYMWACHFVSSRNVRLVY